MYCKYIVVYSFIVPLWNNVLYRVCNLCRVLMLNRVPVWLLFYFVKRMMEKCDGVFVLEL